MHRTVYLKVPEIPEFIGWLSPRLDKDGSFIHQYTSRQNQSVWKCNSIFDAFTQYNWNFSFIDQDGRKITGSTFTESSNALGRLRNQLRIALQKGDAALLCDASRMVFEWGGVRKGNINWAVSQGSELVETFRIGKDLLDWESAIDSLNFVITIDL